MEEKGKKSVCDPIAIKATDSKKKERTMRELKNLSQFNKVPIPKPKPVAVEAREVVIPVATPSTVNVKKIKRNTTKGI